MRNSGNVVMRKTRASGGLTLLAAAGAAVLEACRGPTFPTSVRKPELAVQCLAGTISPDTLVTGDLDSASACRARDLFSGESTFTHSYVFPVEAGRGYLVKMWSRNQDVFMKSRLELVTTGNPAEALLAASRSSTRGVAQLVFVAAATAKDTIRATTVDAAPSDTGAYQIFAQTCKVPVPAIVDSDSIVRTDTIAAGDCQVDLSGFPFGDDNYSNVHLYALHWSGGSERRLISYTSAERLRVFIGGPHDDTFGVTTGTETATTSDSGAHATSFYWASSKPGDYTFLIGTDGNAVNWARYTLSIGPAHPIPVSGTVSIRDNQ
jgi:hypothetical protein